MKKIIGFIIILCSLALAGLVILRIWGVHIVSWDSVLKSGLTLASLGLLTVILLIAYGMFFRNAKKGFTQQQDGSRAHPKTG